ncbi:hypothetical protein ACWEFL_15970 [Streptomyces sp. NPDC004838]
MYLVPVGLFMTAYVSMLVALVNENGSAAVLLVLAIVAGLVTVPLSVWLWVRFSLSPAVAVFERQGAIAAMRRSSKLVSGSWWRVLGVTLLAGVIAGTASYAVQTPLSFMAMIPGLVDTSGLGSDPTSSEILSAISGVLILLAVAQLIGQLIVTVFPQLVVGLLYVDQRIRTENLAPALADASGLPAAAPGPPR